MGAVGAIAHLTRTQTTLEVWKSPLSLIFSAWFVSLSSKVGDIDSNNPFTGLSCSLCGVYGCRGEKGGKGRRGGMDNGRGCSSVDQNIYVSPASPSMSGAANFKFLQQIILRYLQQRLAGSRDAPLPRPPNAFPTFLHLRAALR